MIQEDLLEQMLGFDLTPQKWSELKVVKRTIPDLLDT